MANVNINEDYSAFTKTFKTAVPSSKFDNKHLSYEFSRAELHNPPTEGLPKHFTIKKVTPKIQKIMEGVIKLSVPIIVDGKHGKNWIDMKPVWK